MKKSNTGQFALVLALFACLLLPTAALGTDATIGIYSDPTGSSCSLAGNNAGPLTVYVFVKPGSVGVRGARFSAPIPACFDAAFLGDAAPAGIFIIGDSQTGISVSSGVCETEPFQVLQMTYFSNGATAPCCAYPISADPFTGALEAVNCLHEPTPITSIVSRLNADASCQCGTAPPVYLPPSAPFDPIPADQATFVGVNTQLRWQCTDPNGLGLACDVYLGTTSTPPLVATNIPSAGSTIYSPGTLQPTTTYFWRVVVRNTANLETPGPVWYFTTTGNSAPTVTNQAPSDLAIAVPVTTSITWTASDVDNDPMTFDVYFGPSSSPSLVASGITTMRWTPPSPLSYVTRYWWRIVAHDSFQHSASSMLWSFTTRAENEPPAVPSRPMPPDGVGGISTHPELAWSCSDPDGQALTYDVYLGPRPTPAGPVTVGLYVDSYGSSCSFSGNNTGVVNAYVVVRPGSAAVWEVGLSVAVPACWNATYLGEYVPTGSGYMFQGTSQSGISIWRPVCDTAAFSPIQISFMSNGATRCCPFTVGPNPELGHVEARNCNGLELDVAGVVSHLNADASCECDGIYDVPGVASNLTQPAYSAGALMATTYLWRVVARDPLGLATSSPYWSFTTVGDQPPAVPSNPSPQNAATNVSQLATLSWDCSDPEGQSLTYDVYFGTSPAPGLVASGLATTSYNPGTQPFSTTCYWRIVARDAGGQTTSGPTWSYTTKPPNSPPNAPTVVSPPNGAANQPVNAELKWNATDPDNQALEYDVYFGQAGVSGSGASIGLYTGSDGSTCSFSNPSGVVTAYVVVKPGGTGVQGVRFSAPVPACFGGVYLGDIVPAPLVSIGNSQTGISIASGACSSQPFQVLQILYLGNGGTTACCEYPVLADPFTGKLEAVDCAFQDTPIYTMLSHFNAGAGCTCGNTALPLVAQHVTAKSFSPGPLSVSTQYNWRIVARDPFGLETSGPTWAFATSTTSNLPPLAPSNPNPAIGGTVGVNPVLTWQASDPENDPLTYTVLVYNSFGPPIIGSTGTNQFSPGPLAPGVLYFWSVAAHDGHWSTAGPTWTFQTNNGGGNLPVLFSRFDATAVRGGVQVRWQLQSDEPMDSYTLYRRDGAAGAPLVIAQGAVTAADGTYLDTTAEPGKAYGYQLLIHATAGGDFRSGFANVTTAAIELMLYQNVPNPFNPQTTIRYDLPAPTRVRIAIFDVSGRMVRTLVDEDRERGTHEAVWTGRDDSGQPVSSGVYFYVLEAGKQRLTKKLVLLK